MLESVGLTMDKVLRCAAGIYEGRNERGQCFGAEEILVKTPQNEQLRATLPIGFLRRTLSSEDWVEAMAQHLESLAQDLKRWQSQKKALEPVLRRVLEHVYKQLPRARDWCRDRVYATGAVLKQLDPDERHEAGSHSYFMLFHAISGLKERFETLQARFARGRWRRKLWSTSRSFPRRVSSTSRGSRRCVSSASQFVESCCKSVRRSEVDAEAKSPSITSATPLL